MNYKISRKKQIAKNLFVRIKKGNKRSLAERIAYCHSLKLDEEGNYKFWFISKKYAISELRFTNDGKHVLICKREFRFYRWYELDIRL
jgi:hypothetical protein